MTRQCTPHNLSAVLDSIMTIDSAQGAAVVDARTGCCLAERHASDRDAAGQPETINADTLTIMARIGRLMLETQDLEDIVSTFSGHQYVVRPLEESSMEGLFLFLILERRLDCDVLALARYQLMHIVFGLSVFSSGGNSLAAKF